MPGIYRYGINHLREALEPLIKKGLKSVLLFGVPYHLEKVTFVIQNLIFSSKNLLLNFSIVFEMLKNLRNLISMINLIVI